MIHAQHTCTSSYTPCHQWFVNAAILQCFTYIILFHTSNFPQQNNHFNLLGEILNYLKKNKTFTTQLIIHKLITPPNTKTDWNQIFSTEIFSKQVLIKPFTFLHFSSLYTNSFQSTYSTDNSRLRTCLYSMEQYISTSQSTKFTITQYHGQVIVPNILLSLYLILDYK